MSLAVAIRLHRRDKILCTNNLLTVSIYKSFDVKNMSFGFQTYKAPKPRFIVVEYYTVAHINYNIQDIQLYCVTAERLISPINPNLFRKS